MNIAVFVKYGHRIIRVVDPVGITSDISALRQAIDAAFTEGELHVAVSFHEDSFLSSRTLALLIESAEKATGRGGTMTIIAPNTQILEVLAIFDLEWTLRTVGSEKELLAPPAKIRS